MKVILTLLICFLALTSTEFLATVFESLDQEGPVELFPIVGQISPVDYYQYGTPFASSANLPIDNIDISMKRVNVFLYDFGGNTNLFVVFDKPQNGNGGHAAGEFTITSQQSGAAIPGWTAVLSDDPSESIVKSGIFYKFDYTWLECCTDGFIYGGPTPDNDYCISINFKDLVRITGVEVYSLGNDGTLTPKLSHDLVTNGFVLNICGNSDFLQAEVTNIVDETCPGANDGSITLAIQGNRAPFTVELFSGQSATPFYTTLVETPSESGVYLVNITQLPGGEIISVRVTDNDNHVVEGQEISGNYFLLGSGACSDVSFDWVGQSTQIKLSQTCGCDAGRWLKIKFESIEEIAPNGRVVQKVPNLANAGLELLEEEFETKFGASAKRVFINGPVRIAGSKAEDPVVSIFVWYFLEPAVFPNNGHPLEIPERAIKWDFDVTNWPFKSDEDTLRLNIDVLTPGTNTGLLSEDDNGVSYEVIVDEGELPARLYLPNIAYIDNAQEPTSIGVNVGHRGSHTVISLDFPHFDDNINYDPVSILPSKRCGNRVLDEGEECDFGAYGCTEQCTCVDGFQPSGDVSCVEAEQNVDGEKEVVGSAATIIASFAIYLVLF